jgi:hypothetical protein
MLYVGRQLAVVTVEWDVLRLERQKYAVHYFALLRWCWESAYWRLLLEYEWGIKGKSSHTHDFTTSLPATWLGLCSVPMPIAFVTTLGLCAAQWGPSACRRLQGAVCRAGARLREHMYCLNACTASTA